MAIAFWSAGLFKRKPDGPSALSLAAIVLLFVDPWQLVDPGFVLSFTAVAGLMAFYLPLYKKLQKKTEDDPFVLKSAGLWADIKRFGTALVASSIAAWLATTPLTAWYFNQFSPVALVVNLFVIPLATVILFTGCLSLLAGVCFPFLAEIFNYANVVFVSLMLKIIAWFDRVPGSHFFVQSPAWYWVVLSFAVIVAWFHGSSRVRRGATVTAVAGVLAALALWIADDRVTVETWGAGPASVSLINLPGGGDALVDTGTRFQHRAVLRWLRLRGVDSLHALVITRVRADVMGGAEALLKKIPVKELWLPAFDARSPLYDQLLALASEKKMTVRFLFAGNHGEWPGGAEWEILHPLREGPYGNAAEAQLVFRVARGPSSLLIAGEDHESLDEALAASGRELAASAVLFGSLETRTSKFGTILHADENEELKVAFADRSGWRWPQPEIVIHRVLIKK